MSIATKNDGWANILTGIGVANRDKRVSTTYGIDVTIDRSQCESLYRSNGLGRKVVELPAYEMTREWIDVEGDTDGLMLDELAMIGAKKAMRDMIRWSKVFGGALCVIGCDDGRLQDEPLFEPGIRKIYFLKVYDRYQVNFGQQDLYQDPRHSKYNTPEFYQVSPVSGHPFRVHESRCLKLDGIAAPDLTRSFNQGWGDSIYQALYDALRMLGELYTDIEFIASEFVQGVLSIPGLSEAAGSYEDEKAIVSRAQLWDLTRHIANTKMIDSEETYTHITSSVTGLDGIVDKFIELIAGISGIPVTILVGRSPAGINSTGDSDIRAWYDKVSSDQEEVLSPPLQRLIDLLYICKDGAFRGKRPENGGAIIFLPLWQQSEKEIAETRKIVAETDVLYVNTGVLSPDEVAISRFGGDMYSAETVIEASLRDLFAEPNLISQDDKQPAVKPAGGKNDE